jgi:uncharacterized protein YukE
MKVDTKAVRTWSKEVQQQIDELADVIEDLEAQLAELTTRCGNYEDEIGDLNRMLDEMGAE